MNTIKRGDVYFCQGSPDAAGSEERKSRPVVIIQNDAGNASSPTVIVASMTTNTTRRLYPMQFDVSLPGRAVSRVQCEQIRTVDKARLLELVYTLNDDELERFGRMSGRVIRNKDPQGRPGRRHREPRTASGRHIPPPDPERTVRGRLSASCAGPGERHSHRRERRLSDPKRRRGNRRDRRRDRGHEVRPGRGDALNTGKQAAKKWAAALDIPVEQAIPCVVAFVCLRYHRKSFVIKLAKSERISLWQSVKIGAALFRWGLASKKDPWGELYRITKFVEKLKYCDAVLTAVCPVLLRPSTNARGLSSMTP